MREEPPRAILLHTLGIAQSVHVTRAHDVDVRHAPEQRDAGELHLEVGIDEARSGHRPPHAGGVEPAKGRAAPRFHGDFTAQREDPALEDPPELRVERRRHTPMPWLFFYSASDHRIEV